MRVSINDLLVFLFLVRVKISVRSSHTHTAGARHDQDLNRGSNGCKPSDLPLNFPNLKIIKINVYAL